MVRKVQGVRKVVAWPLLFDRVVRVRGVRGVDSCGGSCHDQVEQWLTEWLSGFCGTWLNGRHGG
uniref:Uncharacterized protein n=1 Tax=Oryza meridionalis TaxID=40149 RepID=A0A0E0ER84_9ORYZ